MSARGTALGAASHPSSGSAQIREACELACLQGTFSGDVLNAAQLQAAELGVGADQVLIRQGVISEEGYLARFSAYTGLPLDTFNGLERNDLLIDDAQILHAACYGIVPIRRDKELIHVLAPRGLAARRTAALAAQYSGIRLALTSHAALHEFITRVAGEALADRAADGLRHSCPHLSAARQFGANRRWKWLAHWAATLAAIASLSVPWVFDAACSLLATWFIAFTVLRLGACTMPSAPLLSAARRKDGTLPIYTIIVALYREASSVAPLLQSLEALDYPREKLDIILAVEPDDLATRAAIARQGPMPHVRTIVAPNHGPKTKPKALNHALTFAQGSLIAVFDAEDRPDPAQLRKAVDLFSEDLSVACVQASLYVENSSDSWLSRMFATEYAGQFDVFLPGLARLRMPLPLGGSSNHFRADVLREVGGWDSYNVTEDADLGFRLARFGYRSAALASSTLEEAPIRFVPWLRQRSRWMKGWMQTWAVHMRSPMRLWRESGWRGIVTLNVLVGGNVLTALAYPALLIGLIGDLAVVSPANVHSPLHMISLGAGFVATIAVGLAGLARQGRLRLAFVLLMTPIYWACLSIAAWRALYQLWRDPYRWEKTEHGLTHERQPIPLAFAPVRRAWALRRAQR